MLLHLMRAEGRSISQVVDLCVAPRSLELFFHIVSNPSYSEQPWAASYSCAAVLVVLRGLSPWLCP